MIAKLYRYIKAIFEESSVLSFKATLHTRGNFT